MRVGHAGQSFRLACLSGKNPRAEDPLAIERQSCGRGGIGAQFHATFWGALPVYAGIVRRCGQVAAKFWLPWQQDNAKLHVAVGCEM